MKNILRNCVIIIVFITASGCAAQFSGKYDKSARVRFTSEPSYLGYYIISILENKQLGSGFDPLKKEDKVLNIIASKNRITARKIWTKVKPGEYVVMVDCGTYVTRNRVNFEDGLDQTLHCSQ